ncbi:hypothetical protein HBH56_097880 [Parastagonospora nodorum]|nr:hypothetical protein HBH56_097880 [Parastagonospora nodorum]KAH3930384.1 hypothetical protein HBH54_112200 [Parastagonospora nodorum]KAH3981157.1 hypothetical protein HBH52_085670 [Parastagonospora nodorum]KAH4028134.1 hypothetical protein HBI13_050770 [Parastagonospora nodorum]KAH4050864.1 hypothetical protein HBH49_124360 [Parastagonospora nodorum]
MENSPAEGNAHIEEHDLIDPVSRRHLFALSAVSECPSKYCSLRYFDIEISFLILAVATFSAFNKKEFHAARRDYKDSHAQALTAIATASAGSSSAPSTALISFSTLFKRKDLKKTCFTSKEVFNKKNLE